MALDSPDESPDSVDMGRIDLSDRTRTRITDQFFQRLGALDSPLVRQAHLSELLARQVDLLLDDIVGGARADGGPSAESLRGAAEFSARRASLDIHPTEAVRAAALFQELALPELIRELLPERPDTAAFLRLTRQVNNAVMTQITLGCVGYIQFLREKLHGSHQDERRRLARDLHDRISHEILVSLLELELYDPAGDSRERLDSASATLRATLDSIGQLADELRTSVTGASLDAAIRAFLPTTVPPGVTVECSVTGDAAQLPAPVAEELYYIIREAVRNATRHADPRSVRIDVAIAGPLIRASVRDDGTGFDVDRTLLRGTGGLTSIRERAALLGGSPEFRSRPGSGTTVSVAIPLVSWDGRV
ncbi:hypothetical protein DF268_37560 [Streptomyces sp. V2]|nr:hypothetical protein DF268_37560 [Streptomyces sp. V2]